MSHPRAAMLVAAWVLGWAVLAGDVPAPVEVLVLPVAPTAPALVTAAGGLRFPLEVNVRLLRGVRSWRVAEEHVALPADPQVAMACTRSDCAAEAAAQVGIPTALLATLWVRGARWQLRLQRVDARTGRAVASEEREVTAPRWTELNAHLPGMLRALFPESARFPALAVQPLSAPPGAAPPPAMEADRLLPAAAGAGGAAVVVAALLAAPVLASTVLLWAGSVYLFSFLQAGLAAGRGQGPVNRLLLQGSVATVLLWPAVVAAPLVLLATPAALAATLLAHGVTQHLWSRRAGPRWLVAVAGAAPVLCASAVHAVPVLAGLFALGAYAAPWAALQSRALNPYFMALLAVAVLGVGAGAGTAYAGAGLTALVVGGVALLSVPAAVGVSLLQDGRPMREDGAALPVDRLLSDLDGGGGGGLR
ncbi:MAG: hypothetical protein HY904_13970 [Deltaproteobacteria bacterium]|nr:hypothetical protein [Deltaproteobacteria bacterium]